MNKLIKSFGWAISGVRTVWLEEINFRIEIAVALLVVAGGIYLNFSKIEWAFIIVCISAVLSTEILNTAIEDLCNKVEPNTDSVIGKIKDMMAGFVLVISFASVIVGTIIFSRYF